MELNPDLNIYQSRGAVNKHLKNYNEAIEDFSHAIDFEKDKAALYFERGGVFEAIQEYNKACLDYQESLRLNSESLGLFDKIHAMLMKLVDTDKAEEWLTKKYHVEQKKIYGSISVHCDTPEKFEYIKNELKGILTQEEIDNFPVIDYEEKMRMDEEMNKSLDGWIKSINETIEKDTPSRIEEDTPKENSEDEEFTIADIKEMLIKTTTGSSLYNIGSESTHCVFCGYENDSKKGLIFTKTDGLQKYKLKDDIVELVNLEKDHIRAEGLEAIKFYIEIKFDEYNNEGKA
jgi:tetratricopeptide (TPR) repeat protein